MFNDDSLVQTSRGQINRQEYQEAIANLDRALENDGENHQALFLRGRAYFELKQYKSALTDLEKALKIQQEIEDIRSQVYTLWQLTFVYHFNGKIKEGLVVQQESFKLLKQLNVTEDDPLYELFLQASKLSDESLEKMQSINSSKFLDRFGWVGKLSAYMMENKIQFYIIYFLLLIPGLIVNIILLPVWILWWSVRQLKKTKSSG